MLLEVSDHFHLDLADDAWILLIFITEFPQQFKKTLSCILKCLWNFVTAFPAHMRHCLGVKFVHIHRGSSET